MSNSEKITAIIPTYRRPHLLRRAIFSVLNQTHPHFKVCVYDNASGDETQEIVRQIMANDPRVEYFCHPTNLGWQKSTQIAIDGVTTPYFNILSDDDVILPKFFETAMEGFGKHPEAGLVGGRSVLMTDRGRVINLMPSRWKKGGCFNVPEGIYQLLGEKGLPHLALNSVLFRTAAVKHIGRLREYPGLGSDIDLILRIAARFSIVYFKSPPLALYVYHSGNFHKRLNPLMIHSGWMAILRNLSEDRNIPSNVRREIERRLKSQVKGILLRHWVLCFSQKKFKENYLIGELLRDPYGERARVWALDRLVQISSRFKIFHNLVSGSQKYLGRWWIRARRLQAEYGHLGKYLEMDQAS